MGRSLERDERESHDRDATHVRYRSLFAFHPDGVCEVDLDGRFLTTNAALEEMTGYSAAELSTMSALQLVHPDERESALARFARAAAGEPTNYDTTCLRRDATSFPANVTGIPIVADDRVVGLFGIARDISDRVSALRALEFSEARYRGLFEGAGSGIAIADLEGRFLDANPAYCDMLGYTAEELRETDVASVTHAGDLVDELVELERLLEGEIPSYVMEKRYVTKAGDVVWARIRASVLRAPDGSPMQLAATTEDITGRKRAEARLERSQSLLRIAGQKARVGGWAIDATTTEVFWSDEVYQILDVDRAAPPALHEGLQLYAPEHRHRMVEAVTACLSDGTPFDLEVEADTLAGRRIFVRVVGEARRRSDGTVAEVIGALQDISELRSAYAAKAEVAERLTNTLESMTDALYILDGEWRFTYLNQRAGELLQRDRDELFGREIWTEFPGTAGTQLDVAYREAMRGQKTVVLDEYHYPPLATWFQVHAYPSPTALTVYFRDITEQHQANLELAERASKLTEQAALLDKARDAILVRGLDATITYWNRRAERLYGWSAEEAVGRSVRELLYDDPCDFDAATATTLRNGEWVGELQQRTRSGGTIVVESRWTLVQDDGGAPGSILDINTDVTERKRLEQQFLRTQRMESLGTLAGGIAHDLNNVLAPIMMAIQLLKMDETDERKVELLRTIESSTQRGADMIRQVLSFARGVEGDHHELDVGDLLREVSRILRDTLPRNIDLRVDSDADLWPIAGEETQLHQVLVNLAVNARDAMPDGGTLRFSAANLRLDEPYAALTGGAEPGHYVRIQVEDQGVGMPPEVADRIFEPFYTTKPHGEGTGLGLSTSLAIVQSHGGLMQVYSEPGSGTTFKLYLPSVTPDDMPEDGDSSAEDLPRGRGELVLLVDDEAAIRQTTSETLLRFGYRVIEAVDGSEAIALFLQHQEDVAVVLTDMMMPIMDGPTAIRSLLELDPTVKIVAVSGLNVNGTVVRAAEYDVEHFLPKPYTARSLLTTLRAAIDGRDAS